MLKKIVVKFLMVTLILSLFSGVSTANDLNGLFKQVEKLKIERQGYMLGKALNKVQLNKAISNPVDAATPDTFKFKDNNLFIVAQKTTHRVLVIYEQFEEATQQKIQDLVGDLYMHFDDPTVLAHDMVVYWAYEKKGKVSSQAFDTAKDNKKTLDILATVKFVSDIKIMEKLKEPAKGHVYYIISSDPILKIFGEQKT
ncbi:MAG: hypothetical protein GY699_26335 [Desulfobacteraceae bacterium]|nr:hypothetical protein [Desulfobacteraceae bacterium]